MEIPVRYRVFGKSLQDVEVKRERGRGREREREKEQM
jgi:hypothetical protein